MKKLFEKEISILILLAFLLSGIIAHELTHDLSNESFSCIACEVIDDDPVLSNTNFLISSNHAYIAISEIKYFYKSKYSSHQSRAPPLI